MLALADPHDFAEALVADMPSRPAAQDRIVSANRAGEVVTSA
jgi:hypothetical protein